MVGATGRTGHSYLMWVLDMAAEAQLLQQPPLSLDHLVLEGDVVAVEDHRLDGPAKDAR